MYMCNTCTYVYMDTFRRPQKSCPLISRLRLPPPPDRRMTKKRSKAMANKEMTLSTRTYMCMYMYMYKTCVWHAHACIWHVHVIVVIIKYCCQSLVSLLTCCYVGLAGRVCFVVNRGTISTSKWRLTTLVIAPCFYPALTANRCALKLYVHVPAHTCIYIYTYIYIYIYILYLCMVNIV